MLHDAELLVDDVEETWRERWAGMDVGERSHDVNVELLDLRRYLAELQGARARGELSAEQARRLDALLGGWERVKPIAGAMGRKLEKQLKGRGAA
jgi:hypothetical protein